MREQYHRIVFKGEIFPGYEMNNVAQNLQRLCGFDKVALDKLFSGKDCILKDKINLRQAQKYKEYLEQTGIVCRIQEAPRNIL